jgi:hypothetical protein
MDMLYVKRMIYSGFHSYSCIVIVDKRIEAFLRPIKTDVIVTAIQYLLTASC